MKIAYRASNITEAEIVKGMLLACDIDAHVSGFYLQGGIGETTPLDLAKVHVADEDYERALELIAEYEGQQPSQTTAHPAAAGELSTPAQRALVTVILIITVSILGYWLAL